MNKNTPTVTSGKLLHSFLEFLHLSGNKGWDYVILGTVGGFVLALLIYGTLIWRGTGSIIQYTPEDVIYGEKLHAVHNMGSGNSSQLSSFSLVNSAEKPTMRLSENYYDFGEVNAHQVLTRTFVIANSGQSPLVIQRAYTTCGCTMADFTATEIPPGKVVLMTLQFDTGYHDMRGTTVRRGVMIETNDPDHPTQEIWVQASVR